MRRLAYSLVCAVTVFALAACGKAEPTGTGDADPNLPAGETLGENAGTSTTVEPTPTVTDGDGPEGPDDDGPEPHASHSSRVGYAWISNASASHTVTTAYSFNSSGGAISVDHLGTGSYRVTFAGLATAAVGVDGLEGIAHASAYGPASNYCTVSSWTSSGADQRVSVRCYNAAGAVTNSPFTVSFTAGSLGNARFGYLWANQQGNPEAYQPSADYRYDSVDSTGISVQRTGVGRYDVSMPSFGPLSSPNWTFQITGYASAAQCKLGGFSAASKVAKVTCRSAAGAYQDSRFSLSFAESASFVGRADRPYGNFSDSSSGVENPSTGVYVVRAPNLGSVRGQATAVAFDNSATACHVRNWATNGADLNVTVVCFNPGGAPASAKFHLAVTG